MELDAQKIAEAVEMIGRDGPHADELLNELNDMQLAALYHQLIEVRKQVDTATVQHLNRMVTMSLPAWAMAVVLVKALAPILYVLDQRVDVGS